MFRSLTKILFLRYRPAGSYPQWHDSEFVAELKLRGIAFEFFEFDTFGDSISDEVFATALENRLKASRPGEVILSCLFDRDQSRSGIFDLISNAEIPSVQICFDNLQVWYKHVRAADCYDILWITSPDADQRFRKSISKVVYEPYGAYCSDGVPLPSRYGISKNLMATFFGTPYGVRGQYLANLVGNDVDVRCFGGSNGVSNKKAESSILRAFAEFGSRSKTPTGRKLILGGALNRLSNPSFTLPDFQQVPNEDLKSLFSASSLMLNSSVVWNTHLLSSPVHKGHLRLFEVPASYGLQIIEDTEMFRDWFEPNKEAIVFSSSDEMLEMLRFYLRDEMVDTLYAMKLAARQRVVLQHTWTHRFASVFGKL